MLHLTDLTPQVRQLMAAEVQADIAAGTLYLSPRLTDRGRADYPQLLLTAVTQFDDHWFREQLNSFGRIKRQEQRRSPKGMRMVAVPHTAAETLAEGEFNRFYLRGLCQFALGSGVPSLVIYRAKRVENARPESSAKINHQIDARDLLNDLRLNNGVDTALGVPAGPNSGLSAKLP